MNYPTPQEIVNNLSRDKVAMGYASTMPSYKTPRGNLWHVTEATVRYHKAGLRGHQLRRHVRQDCGMGILSVIQIALLVAKIVGWIRRRNR